MVVVEVEQRFDEVAQTSDGRILRRQGGRNVAVFGSDLWAMMTARTLRRYEHSDSHVPMDSVRVSIADQVADAYGWPPGYDRVARWTERKLLSHDANLTIAGALVLTDPAMTLEAAKLLIDIRSYERDDTTSYVRREAIGGPLQQQIVSATDWILRDVGPSWSSPARFGTTFHAFPAE